MIVEDRRDLGSGEGRIRVEDSEEAYGGIDVAVGEGEDEGEEEGGEREFGEREEELLGEGEGGGADGGAGGGDGVFDGVGGEVELFECGSAGDWGLAAERGDEVAPELRLREDSGDECGGVAEELR